MKTSKTVVAFSFLTIFLLALAWQAAAQEATPTPAPVAEFSGNVTTGTAPLAVQFTDASTGNVTGWSWDFGDGNTSTLRDPIHVFSAPGLYTVSLTAMNASDSNTSRKANYVNATAAPTPTPSPTPKLTPTPTKKPTPRVTPKPSNTPTPSPTPAAMPTVPPELWDEINRSFATATPLPPPPQVPTPGPTLVPLPSQEPSPAPTPAGRDHVPGLVAFAGFNLLVVSLYASISYLFFRR